MQEKFYEHHPFLLGTMPDVGKEEIRKNFKPFDASPAKRKERTDAAKTLLSELKSLHITNSELKTREARALAQLEYFLDHNFDFPLEHYDKGLWMLGPDYLCNHISCDIGNHLKTIVKRFTPETLKDLEMVGNWFLDFGKTFDQLIENLALGVSAGMVQPREVCLASIDALEQAYPLISENGPEGVLEEYFGWYVVSGNFLSSIDDNIKTAWKKKYEKSVEQSMEKALVEGFGKPWKKYVDYLKNEHLQHCVTSEVASGLSRLPLDYVYVNGKPDQE